MDDNNISAPTRELAFQIHEVFTAIGTAIGAFCVCIVGGVDLTSQAIALAKNPHIVTATPGRLCDHLVSTKGFHLRNVSYLVMDEADRMLSMDFEKELNQILDVMPSGNGKDARGGGRRTMLFRYANVALHMYTVCSYVRFIITFDLY